MVLDRRRFLQALGAAGLAAPVPRWARAETHPAERCLTRFRAAAAKQPALDPWRSLNAERLEPLSMQLEGRLPKGLRGTLYRNGPAGFERAGARYQHWFDGDGMVQAFRLSDDGITHHGRKVATAKWKREEAEGRFLHNGAGSTVPHPEHASGNDGTNPANISVVPWGEDLLALWEAGSPYALDPSTLETRRRVVFSKETDAMPFSAHPLVERDGRMWNFGLAQWAGESGTLVVYGLSPKAGLERVGMIPLPFAGYMHSFAMTERWMVFYLSPYVFERKEGSTYVGAHAWQPKRGGRFLLVDKNDFEKRRWIEAPPGFIFHFADAVDRPGGGVSLRTCWSERPSTMSEGMFEVMCGEDSSFGPEPGLMQVDIDGAGTAKFRPLDVEGEFPIVDPRGASPFLVVAGDTALTMLDAKGRSRRLRPSGRVRLEEHRFVPRSAQLGDGWLVGTGYDLDKRASVLMVFDTASDGGRPVVQATMDRRIPFGFHGCFVSA